MGLPALRFILRAVYRKRGALKRGDLRRMGGTKRAFFIGKEQVYLDAGKKIAKRVRICLK
jgi:hypothetical protein